MTKNVFIILIGVIILLLLMSITLVCSFSINPFSWHSNKASNTNNDRIIVVDRTTHSQTPSQTVKVIMPFEGDKNKQFAEDRNKPFRYYQTNYVQVEQTRIQNNNPSNTNIIVIQNQNNQRSNTKVVYPSSTDNDFLNSFEDKRDLVNLAYEYGMPPIPGEEAYKQYVNQKQGYMIIQTESSDNNQDDNKYYSVPYQAKSTGVKYNTNGNWYYYNGYYYNNNQKISQGEYYRRYDP